MNLVKYIKDSFEELRNKVSWISWEEAQKSTVVVAIFTVLFALAVGGIADLLISSNGSKIISRAAAILNPFANLHLPLLRLGDSFVRVDSFTFGQFSGLACLKF